MRLMTGSELGHGMHKSSNGCLGRAMLVLLIIHWAASLAVLDAVEKNGGDLHHPIGNVHCTTI